MKNLNILDIAHVMRYTDGGCKCVYWHVPALRYSSLFSMNAKLKVSVVVPIYNAEVYLREYAERDNHFFTYAHLAAKDKPAYLANLKAELADMQSAADTAFLTPGGKMAMEILSARESDTAAMDPSCRRRRSSCPPRGFSAPASLSRPLTTSAASLSGAAAPRPATPRGVFSAYL